MHSSSWLQQSLSKLYLLAIADKHVMERRLRDFPGRADRDRVGWAFEVECKNWPTHPGVTSSQAQNMTDFETCGDCGLTKEPQQLEGEKEPRQLCPKCETCENCGRQNVFAPCPGDFCEKFYCWACYGKCARTQFSRDGATHGCKDCLPDSDDEREQEKDEELDGTAEGKKAGQLCFGCGSAVLHKYFEKCRHSMCWDCRKDKPLAGETCNFCLAKAK